MDRSQIRMSLGVQRRHTPRTTPEQAREITRMRLEKIYALRFTFRSDAEWKRALLKTWWKYTRKEGEVWVRAGYPLGWRATRIPYECMDMTCGAMTRAGRPCRFRISQLCFNGRCKYHGGASTGPKTAFGKAVSAANGYKKRSP